MASLDNYIAELNFLAENLHNVVGDAGVKNEQYIVRTQNNRLEGSGTDAKGNPIGSYSATTINIKRGKGQATSHVTL